MNLSEELLEDEDPLETLAAELRSMTWQKDEWHREAMRLRLERDEFRNRVVTLASRLEAVLCKGIP